MQSTALNQARHLSQQPLPPAIVARLRDFADTLLPADVALVRVEPHTAGMRLTLTPPAAVPKPVLECLEDGALVIVGDENGWVLDEVTALRQAVIANLGPLLLPDGLICLGVEVAKQTRPDLATPLRFAFKRTPKRTDWQAASARFRTAVGALYGRGPVGPDTTWTLGHFLDPAGPESPFRSQ